MSETVVYFVKAGNAIKIGFTSDLAKRLRVFVYAQPEPVTVLGIKLGGRAEEAELHRRLARYRLNGEWFQDCPEVRAAIGEGLIIEITPNPPSQRRKPHLVRKPRATHVRQSYTPTPPSQWFLLSDRVKRLDDAIAALGVPRDKGVILYRALSEFSELFRRHVDEDSPELLARATAVIQSAERDIAA